MTLDFNTTGSGGGFAHSPSFDEVNAAALAAYPGLLQQWFPLGRRQGQEFVVGNLQGDAGESLSINIKSGVWKDFADGHGGGDPISLYATINGLKQGEAKTQMAEELGLVGNSDYRDRDYRSRPDKTPEQRRDEARAIRDASIPALYSWGQKYLQGRGITIPPPTCLRYNPGIRALVALIQARDGSFSGIQRIYLTTDARGTWKRERRSLGPVKGGAIRLTPAAETLHLCESLEDGLALLQMIGKETWAVPGAGFLADFEPPSEMRELILAPDHDKAGLEAIKAAANRNLGVAIRQLLPPVGMDWCNLLEEFDERVAILEYEGEETRDTAEQRTWVEAFSDGG